MKRFFLFFTICFCGFASAQDEIVWKVKYDTIAHEIQFTAKLKEHWHLYSQYVLNDLGPVPTYFEFDFNDKIVYEGPVKEPKPIEKYDASFEATLNFFEEEATFTRKIKELKNNQTITITGNIHYMVCDDTRCIPPTSFPFSITIQ